MYIFIRLKANICHFSMFVLNKVTNYELKLENSSLKKGLKNFSLDEKKVYKR